MMNVDEALAIGLAHHRSGNRAEAEKAYRQVLQAEPRNANALRGLGLLAGEAGQLEPAVQLLKSAAIQFCAAGDLAAAEAALREALGLRPGDIPARAQLGRVLHYQNRFADAEACFRTIVAAASDSPEAHRDLGIELQTQGKLDAAADSFRIALRLRPDYAEAHNNLGETLGSLGRHADAVFHCRRATELAPGFARAWSDLAVGLQAVGQIDEGIAAAQKAIELDATLADGYWNLGNGLQALGQIDEAVSAYRAAAALDPANAALASNLLYTLNFNSTCGEEAIFAEHRTWAQRHADPLWDHHRPYANRREPARRLRVGYVSAHFCRHAVRFFIEPILASHDQASFEVFCYADVAHEDDDTRRLRNYADTWRTIVDRTDEQASEMIRADRIDILVDLAGHIAGNRLLVFARKPAPVQVSYIGYQNTTGMLAMDYRVTDAWADPPGETDALYTEQLVRLPQTFFCYRPAQNAPASGPVPALKNRYVTFGSFNTFTKIGPEVLDTWARILQAVPASRILLLAPESDSLRRDVCAHFARHGVAADRIAFRPRTSYLEYLALIAAVDIALDPFPFNGHTTTCDALWMGVAVVMRSGRTYASRFGGTALLNVGLADLITLTNDHYIETAVRLANDLQRRVRLRAELRTAMQNSPITAAREFTHNLESAYRQMWIRWCSSSAATSNP